MEAEGLVRILPVGEADLESISKLAEVIWKACYPDILSAEQIDYMLARMYAPETMRDEIRSRGIRYDRLMVGETCSGFAAYGPEGSSEVFKLHKLYLLPEKHGRGLGSLLLRHCEQEVRGLGARRLILNVNKNNRKAITAYQRNGFVVATSVIADIGGGFFMDDYVMEKVLQKL